MIGHNWLCHLPGVIARIVSKDALISFELKSLQDMDSPLLERARIQPAHTPVKRLATYSLPCCLMRHQRATFAQGPPAFVVPNQESRFRW